MKTTSRASAAIGRCSVSADVHDPKAVPVAARSGGEVADASSAVAATAHPSW